MRGIELQPCCEMAEKWAYAYIPRDGFISFGVKATPDGFSDSEPLEGEPKFCPWCGKKFEMKDDGAP